MLSFEHKCVIVIWNLGDSLQKKKGRLTMKKIVALFLVCLLLVSAVGCTPSFSGSQSNKTPNNSYQPNNSQKLTISEKEDIAEKQALKKALEYMKTMSSKFSKYDIDATRYKIGAITHSGNKFTVNGTLYLYDKYGSLEDTATFSGSVEVEDNGSYKAYYPTIKIK